MGALLALLVLAAPDACRAHGRKYLEARAYDPSAIEPESWVSIVQVLRHVETSQPRNLFFFSAASFNPFRWAGEHHTTWGLLVDRRRLKGGLTADRPLPLDLERAYEQITERVCRTPGPGVLPARFHVDDVVFVNGSTVSALERRFLNDDLTPRLGLDAAQVKELHDADGHAGAQDAKVFRRITFYHAQRDLSIRSFIRLQHQGAFTYIESVGTRMLPLFERLSGKYSDRDTSSELEWNAAGPAWWQALDPVRRRRLLFVLAHFLIALVVWLVGGAATGALGLGTPGAVFDEQGAVRVSGLDGPEVRAIRLGCMNLFHLAYLLFVVAQHYEAHKLPRLDDIYEPKADSPLDGREKQRLKLLRRRRHLKEAGEFDFGPVKAPLRYSQSREGAETFFESTDLRLLRRTQDVAVQEAFVKCLDEAGIDTSEFRQGMMHMTNYGIINSGHIGGTASSEVAVEAKSPDAAHTGPTADKSGKNSGIFTANIRASNPLSQLRQMQQQMQESQKSLDG